MENSPINNLKNFKFKYLKWLNTENPRALVPNWKLQMMMGVFLVIGSLMGADAMGALLSGKSWIDKTQTAVRDGKPVLLPIGTQVTIGFLFLVVGGTLILSAWYAAWYFGKREMPCDEE